MTNHVPPQPLWTPGRTFTEQSNLKRYLNWLFVKKGLHFRQYHDLWDWSVTDLEDFWESILLFNEVKLHADYRQIIAIKEPTPGQARWFLGATLNVAEAVFKQKSHDRPALIVQRSDESSQPISWKELEKQVAATTAYLRTQGIGMGSKVCSSLSDSYAQLVSFLAVAAIGGVWCPTATKFAFKLRELPPATSDRRPEYSPVPFEQPLLVWPDAEGYHRTYSGGGWLLEQLKTLVLHQNLRRYERCLCYGGEATTTIVGAAAVLVAGATPVLFEGNAQRVWHSVEMHRVNCLATSVSFLAESMTGHYKITAGKQRLLQNICLVGPFGSVEIIEWLQHQLGKDLNFTSLGQREWSGSCQIGSNPLLPIYGDSVSTPLLGCKMDSAGQVVQHLPCYPLLTN